MQIELETECEQTCSALYLVHTDESSTEEERMDHQQSCNLLPKVMLIPPPTPAYGSPLSEAHTTAVEASFVRKRAQAQSLSLVEQEQGLAALALEGVDHD